jgi:IS30 family transposase
MDRRSKHLSSEERGVILAEHNRGSSQQAIGVLLDRSASTICRELARGRQDDGAYCRQAARLVYDVRRSRCRRARKLVVGGATHSFVHSHLVHRRWSPEQIAHRLRRMHPDDPAARVSHETIYAAIYAQPRGGLKAAMIEALRQGKPVRGLKRTTLAGSAMVPEALRIINSPEEIEGRLVPGHREGDLIKGAFNRSSVGTLVERKTRFVVLCKMNGNGAEAVLDSFTRQMKRLPAALRKSMTYDRGSEMTCHPELARRLKIDIWLGRSACPLAARQQREHQRLAATVHAQRHRPQRCQPNLAQRYRSPDEQPPQKNPRLENTRRSHGRRNGRLQ